MNKQVVSYYEMNSSLADISMAFNGLLNISGDLKQVYDQYNFNVKQDQTLERSPEKQGLRVVYNTFTDFSIHLSELSPTKTRINYTLTYTRRNQIILGIIFTLLLTPMILLLGSGIITELVTSSLNVFVFVPFFIIMLMLAGMWLVILNNARPKSMNNLFHKQFLPRLVQYTQIVEAHNQQKQMKNSL